MGVSQQAVDKWERGKSVPRPALLPQLAELLGCTLEQLLGDESDTDNNSIAQTQSEKTDNESGGGKHVV